MARQPNLFLLGAPKCGTTSLSRWLEACPEVYVPSVKEPHHYNRDEQQVYFRERDDYLALFDTGQSFKYRLDASVWYLHSRVAVPNILEDCPDARFLVCLRNPVDMAFSLHSQYLHKTGRECVASFEKAWSLSDERLRGRFVDSLALEPAYLAYKYSCLIGTQSERLLGLVPRDRVHFVILDDLISQPQETLKSLLVFLNLSEHSPLAFPRENVSINRRSPTVHRMFLRLAALSKKLGVGSDFLRLKSLMTQLNTTTTSSEISPKVRRMVTEYFLPEIQKIWEITGVRYGHWLGDINTAQGDRERVDA